MVDLLRARQGSWLAGIQSLTRESDDGVTEQTGGRKGE